MKIAKYFDLFARSFIVFLIAYLWLTFYIKDILIVFVLAFGIMLGVNLLIKFIPRRKLKVAPPDYIKPITKPLILNPMFCRARIKRYILIGFIIFGTSFIVSFNIYYILIATVMFLFAFISTFNIQSIRDDIPDNAFQRDSE